MNARTLLIGLAALAVVSADEQRRAIVALRGKEGVSGNLVLTQTDKGVQIEGQILGLEPGKHGFHVHAKGDLTNDCASTGGHFNPHNKTHGAKSDSIRHVGDLGNIEAASNGEAHISILDNVISLGGEHCILGRAIVVHSGEDDLGKGGAPDSLTTGNAGGRVACGVIGILSPEVWWEAAKGSSGPVITGSLVTSTLATIFALLLL